MEKNPGGQKFWQRREGRFREILSCPPPKMRVAPQMPPPNSETWRRHWDYNRSLTPVGTFDVSVPMSAIFVASRPEPAQ